MTGAVHPASPPPTSAPAGGSGGGQGDDLRERVAKLEAHLQHLATKTDVEGIKTWALRGAIGGMVLAASLSIAVLKLFP